MAIDIKRLAQVTIPQVKAAAQELSKLKGWKFGTILAAIQLLPMVIKRVEIIGALEKLAGKEKQELAIELALQLLDRPWWLPEGLLRPALKVIIDSIVDAYQDSF